MTGDVWYFAYGSNLDAEQKELRTDTIREAHRARAPHFRFTFNKAADDGTAYAKIAPDDTEVVWGVVYLCSPGAMERMDIFEGVRDGHYKRAHIRVITDQDIVLEAVTYIGGARFLVPDRRARPAYLGRIIAGARAHGLPNSYIRKIRALGRRPA